MRRSSRRPKSLHVAMYGSVGMLRKYCYSCGTTALVIDGVIQCCDRAIEESPLSVMRESDCEAARRTPSAAEKAEIPEAQGNACLYCEQVFGSYHIRNGRAVRLKLHWDHQRACNFAAACHVCNGLKSSRLFASIDAAKSTLALDRQARGWSF